MKKINFYEFDTVSKLLDKILLKKYLDDLFKKEEKDYETISIIFCSDEYLFDLNQKFLKHSYYTDTMTFILNNKPITGEIYISIDRVKENSRELGIKYQNELIRVIIHSCLHLCGYTDRLKGESVKMMSVQEKYLNGWLVSRETQIGG